MKKSLFAMAAALFVVPVATLLFSASADAASGYNVRNLSSSKNWIVVGQGSTTGGSASVINKTRLYPGSSKSAQTWLYVPSGCSADVWTRDGIYVQRVGGGRWTVLYPAPVTAIWNRDTRDVKVAC